MLSSLLLEVLTERWTRVFLSVRIFQSVRYLVLRQVNGPATLQLSVVSSSSQVFSAAASPFRASCGFVFLVAVVVCAIVVCLVVL